MRVPQNCLCVSNLSTVPCLYEGCNSAVVFSWQRCPDSFYNFKLLLAWRSRLGLSGSTKISKI